MNEHTNSEGERLEYVTKDGHECQRLAVWGLSKEMGRKALAAFEAVSAAETFEAGGYMAHSTRKRNPNDTAGSNPVRSTQS